MYEFATGVINVIDKKIFNKNQQERMLNAPDFNSAFEVLYDTDLALFLEKNKQIDDVILEDLKAQSSFLKKISDSKFLVEFLFLRFDVNYIKYIIKKYFFKEIENIKFFTFSKQQSLKEYIEYKLDYKFNKEKKIYFKILPELSKTQILLIDKIINKLPENPSSFDIEYISDKEFMKFKLKLANEISDDIKYLSRFEVDFLNIKNLLRFKDNKKIIDKIFLKNGNLSKTEILELVNFKEEIVLENVEKFLEIFGFSNIIKQFKRHKNFLKLNNEFLRYYTEFIFEISKKSAYGPEKIIEYFLKKLNSYHNIKLILFAKRYNIEISEIEDILLPV